MAAERLQKILSHAGVSSRRAAEELILAGRVAVNGAVVTQLGTRADPESDEVTVDGVPVLRTRYRYIALHKPRGVVTSASDELGRDTVLELVPGARDAGLHPVGRLDKDSEGLLLLTNDGHLTNLLTHPRNEVEKEYLVEIDRAPAKRDIERMVRGVEEGGERLRARSVREVSPPGYAPGAHWLSIVLTQGKKREIRRLLSALDYRVGSLRRVRIAGLHLGRLKVSAWRDLSEAEVSALYEASAGKPGS